MESYAAGCRASEQATEARRCDNGRVQYGEEGVGRSQGIEGFEQLKEKFRYCFISSFW